MMPYITKDDGVYPECCLAIKTIVLVVFAAKLEEFYILVGESKSVRFTEELILKVFRFSLVFVL